MSDLQGRDWDDWAAAWRRDTPMPSPKTQAPGLPPRRRPAAVLATIVCTVTHLVMVYWLLFGLTGTQAVLLGMRLVLLGVVLVGARELLRRIPWETPSGYDALSVHLERLTLAVEASGSRLRRLLIVLVTLALMGGPVTWAAWKTLDGDSAIPYLPRPEPSLWLGALAAAYGILVALRMARVGRMAEGLREARDALAGEEGPPQERVE